MLTKKQTQNMGLLQQRRHKLEGKLEILDIILKDLLYLDDSYTKCESAIDAINSHYVELQKDYANELTIVENELTKLYKLIKT